MKGVNDLVLEMENQGSSARLMVTTVFILLSLHQSCSVETYSLSYSYFDEIAQSYCASVGFGFVFAIRRNCAWEAPTCNDMCENAEIEILSSINFIRSNVSCFDALHVWKNHPILKANPAHTQPDAGRLNLRTYSYGSGGCTWTPNHCGPNYCCCKAY